MHLCVGLLERSVRDSALRYVRPPARFSGRIEPRDIVRIISMHLRSRVLERTLRDYKHMHKLHRRKVERRFWSRRQPVYQLLCGEMERFDRPLHLRRVPRPLLRW